MSYEAWGEPDGRPLPKRFTRCSPSMACKQKGDCARADGSAVAPVVDASLCLAAGWCPMFLDKRGVALLKKT